MTKQEASKYYTAYADLESAAEAFYTAAQRMADLVPEMKPYVGMVCDEVNAFVVGADQELDEVL